MGKVTSAIRRYTVARLSFEIIALLSGGLIVTPIALTTAAHIERASLLPQLVQLNSILGRHFLSPSKAHVVSTGDGILVQPDPGRWPGISLDVWPDWRGYSALLIELTNPNTRKLSVVVRIDDRRPDPQDNDRYNRQFQLEPQSRRVIRIPLAEIESAPKGPAIDLAHVQKIILFEDGSAPTYTFCLNSLRLER
jgi:hypothetical protein